MSTDFYKTCQGMAITPGEREWLRDTAASISAAFPHPVIVNIGVAWGASCHCLRAGAPDASLYGVELMPTSYRLEEPDLLSMAIIAGNSGTLWTQFNKSIHLLFIDGCHHKGPVLDDIRGWTPKIVVGGIVAFHDYAPTKEDLRFYPDLIGVRTAVDEWQPTQSWCEIPAPDSIKAFRRP